MAMGTPGRRELEGVLKPSVPVVVGVVLALTGVLNWVSGLVFSPSLPYFLMEFCLWKGSGHAGGVLNSPLVVVPWVGVPHFAGLVTRFLLIIMDGFNSDAVCLLVYCVFMLCSL